MVSVCGRQEEMARDIWRKPNLSTVRHTSVLPNLSLVGRKKARSILHVPPHAPDKPSGRRDCTGLILDV